MSSTPAHPPWKAVVDAVRKFYTFLAADLGGIPSHSIVEPPASGWRTVTEASLAGLEKTSAVIDALRHLPYIQHDPDRCIQIAFATRAADYRNMQTSVGERSKYFPHGSTDFSAHVVMLSCNEEGSGSWLLFDTERGTYQNRANLCTVNELTHLIHTGTITDYLPAEPVKQGAPDPESPDFWRSFETLPPAEIFAVWEHRFRSLEWTVNPFDVDDGMMVRWDRGTDVSPAACSVR
jgi:hypothetical protein